MSSPRILGYSDRISVGAGDSVEFKVHCDEPGEFTAELVRIVCGDATPGGAGFEVARVDAPFAGVHAGTRQRTCIGSRGVVELRRLGPAELGGSFTLQAMVFPTALERGVQGILGTWSEDRRSGASLVVAADASLGLLFRDGAGRVRLASTGAPLPARYWTLVSASYDAARRLLTLRQRPQPVTAAERFGLRTVVRAIPVEAGIAPIAGEELLFAALREGPSTRRSGSWADRHFDGKIDRPRWSAAALPEAEVEALCETLDPGALPPMVVACWDFSRDVSSTRLRDIGPHRLHGTTVNLPARAVTGFDWDGRERDWRRAPEQYGAIHFHSDDLYDAEWETAFRYRVPAELPSGIYAARVSRAGSVEHLPFFVRPAPGSARAPIAFLASTATYLAYGNARSGQDLRYAATGDPKYRGSVYHALREHPELGLSCYDVHADGSGVQFASRLRPILDTLRPGTEMLWGFALDTLITAWLERRGHPFDVITDEDLDREGVELLRPYRVVLTGAHPEYVSRPMRAAVDAYLAGGGRLVYFGGNGFYWIVSFSERAPGAMELRRVQTRPSMWEEAVGQAHHAFDGEHGGLWECSDLPQARSLGVGFVGMAVAVRTEYEPAKDTLRSRAGFALEGVAGTIVNDFGAVYGPLLADEYDRCDAAAGTPPHAIVVATSKPQPREQLVPSRRPETDGSQADMVFLECERGGAVFAFSSISWALGLAANGYANDVCRTSENVLRRFLDPAPFGDPPAPGEGGKG